MIKSRLNSLGFAIKGIATVWKEETNFRIIVVISIALIFSAYYFCFSFIETALCIFTVTVLMISEMINTAIEDVCNKIEPNIDPAIGKIKDISSGFTLIASIGAGVVGLLVLANHFLL